MRIAIQGEAGSFHHQAAITHFGDAISIVPSETFMDVFGLLNRHEADAAVVAIENSLYGSINEVYDLIESHGYPIIGEVHLKIEQHLIGLPDTTLEMIKKVYSHPVALAQCSDFLDTQLPGAERIEYYDTAASLDVVTSHQDPSIAGIASRQAAVLYDLPILKQSVQNHSQNFTRFLVIQPHGHAPRNANRSSLVVTTNHQSGALVSVLAHFANASINLAKLQSRPIVGQPWQYKFYLVVETSGSDLADVVAAIRADGHAVTILGEYSCTAP